MEQQQPPSQPDDLNSPSNKATTGSGGARGGAGRKAYQPTQEDRERVKILVAGGATEAQMAKFIGANGISEKTLRRHFRRELETAKTTLDALAFGTMASQIKGGNTAMVMFYLKTRCGYRELGMNEADQGQSRLNELMHVMRAGPAKPGPQLVPEPAKSA